MNSEKKKSYGWKNIQPPQSCNYVAPAVIKICKKLKVHTVLDIGSGNGALCGLLSNSGFQVAGTEYDLNGYELSCENYPQIKFYNIGVHEDPAEIMKAFPDGFDCVISTEVIEHLYSPQKLPAFTKKVQNKGYLILSTPYHGYLKNLALSIFNKWDIHHTPLWEGGHIKFWSKKTLSSLLEQNGFKVIGFKGTGRIPFFWKSMILLAKNIDCTS